MLNSNCILHKKNNNELLKKENIFLPHLQTKVEVEKYIYTMKKN